MEGDPTKAYNRDDAKIHSVECVAIENGAKVRQASKECDSISGFGTKQSFIPKGQLSSPPSLR